MLMMVTCTLVDDYLSGLDEDAGAVADLGAAVGTVIEAGGTDVTGKMATVEGGVARALEAHGTGGVL